MKEPKSKYLIGIRKEDIDSDFVIIQINESGPIVSNVKICASEWEHKEEGGYTESKRERVETEIKKSFGI